MYVMYVSIYFLMMYPDLLMSYDVRMSADSSGSGEGKKWEAHIDIIHNQDCLLAH